MNDTEDLRDRWEEIDDAINLMPESILVEALENPHLSQRDKARVKARLAGGNGHKRELAG